MNSELEEKNCLLYKYLNLLGKKWMIFLLLKLSENKKEGTKYSEFEKILPNVTSRIISIRLSELIEYKLITKENHTYKLAQTGLELIPIIRILQQWGRKNDLCKPYQIENCKRCNPLENLNCPTKEITKYFKKK